jgi:ankyrin repeat protein
MDTRSDFFSILPDETIAEIFGHLELPITKIYPSLSVVNKDFNRVILKARWLWTSFSFVNCNEPKPVFHLLQFLSSHDGLLTAAKEFEVSCYKRPGFSFSHLMSPMFEHVEKLCLRHLTLIDDAPKGAVVWGHIRILNVTNLVSEQFFAQVTAPKVEVLVVSGVRGVPNAVLVQFILRSSSTLRRVDVSRTALSEDEVHVILRACKKLEVMVATEMRWRAVEDSLAREYPRTKVIVRLLSHWLEPLKKRRQDVACLYDVDGNGCSLLADAIYVGIKADVIKYMIEEFDMDVNRCGELPPPWVVPYPTKIVENFELLRSPLGFHQALLLNKFDIATLLIEKGADIDLKTPEGLSPILSVMQSASIDSGSRQAALKFLLEHGASVDSLVARLALDRPIDSEVLEELLQRVPDEEISVALFHCVSHDRAPLVTLLLQRGANPAHSLIQGGDTALVASIRRKHLPTIQAFLSSASVTAEMLNRLDKSHSTPLHYAVKYLPLDQLSEVFQAMVSRGADVSLLGGAWAGSSADQNVDSDKCKRIEMVRRLSVPSL